MKIRKNMLDALMILAKRQKKKWTRTHKNLTLVEWKMNRKIEIRKRRSKTTTAIANGRTNEQANRYAWKTEWKAMIAKYNIKKNGDLMKCDLV